MIAGPNLLSRVFPPKSPRTTVTLLFIGSLSLYLFALTVKNNIYDNTSASDFLFDVALLSGAPLILFFILLSFRKLVTASPQLCVFTGIYSLAHLRWCVWLFATMMIVATCDVNSHIICILSAVLFLAAELFMNVAMYLRITNRIKEGKYSFDGPGFWNSKAAYDKIIVATKVVSGILMATVAISFIGELNDKFYFTYFDFQELVNIIAVIFLFFCASLVCLFCAYFNVKQSLILYCYLRFKNSIDDFYPNEEDYDEE